MKSFCRWAVADRRIAASPIEHLKPMNAKKVRSEQRRKRRALSVDEVRKLLQTSLRGPERDGMSGLERAMLYRLAAETGLRSSELRSLTGDSFVLEGPEPLVFVQGSSTKNKEPASIPLRIETACDLASFFEGKNPDSPAFPMPRKDRIAQMLRADLREAGIPYGQSSEKEIVDFHSLRHTCGTLLSASGVHPKLIQRIMRHSSITLTMDRYTHAFREDEVAAIAKLPDLAPRFEKIILDEKSGLSAGLKAEDLRVAFRDPQGGKAWIKGGGAVDSKGVPNGEDTPENTAKTKGLPLKIREEIGGPPGNRTPNLRIKSPSGGSANSLIQIGLTPIPIPSGSRSGIRDEILAQIIRAWPKLPESLKNGLLALIEAHLK